MQSHRFVQFGILWFSTVYLPVLCYCGLCKYAGLVRFGLRIHNVFAYNGDLNKPGTNYIDYTPRHKHTVRRLLGSCVGRFLLISSWVTSLAPGQSYMGLNTLESLYRLVIWQAARNHCCQNACQIYIFISLTWINLIPSMVITYPVKWGMKLLTHYQTWTAAQLKFGKG